MNYQEAIQYLYSANLQRGVKLDLSRMEALTLALGNPQKSFRSIHVAGTNGKGSVSTKIAKGLELAGYKVGLFTSPHISTFRERIQINHEMISEEEVLSNLRKILPLGEEPTFFEMTTLLAFLHFEKQKVDFAVLETGIGGRLDATNIITPILSLITSIGFDHMEILGSTLDEIAREKGGIIKQGIPVLIGPKVPFKPIQEIAERLKAPLEQIEGSFKTYDRENSALAKAALDHLGIPSEEAIKMRPPCRLEEVPPEKFPFPCILDVAHNPDGLIALFHSLETLRPGKTFPCIVGMSSSKDLEACLKILAENTEHLFLVEANNPRSAKVEDLAALLEKMGKICFTRAYSIEKALEKIHSETLITGTFFLMDEAKKALGIRTPSDPLALNEHFGLGWAKRSIK